jgi:hypothetical protein
MSLRACRVGILVSGAAVCALAAFLLYSASVTFGNWPWTVTETWKSGGVLGFEVGASKLEAFRRAIAAQRERSIEVLWLVDEPPGVHADRFQGLDLADRHWERVRASDRWKLSLVGENAWLLLEFEADRLAAITRQRYRGPTE